MGEFNKDTILNVSSSDAVGKIVNSLMFFRQGGETETFAKCAIESLVKKLKDKQDELDALIISVVTGGQQTTKCSTVPRTLDGRIQIAGKKCFPHLLYTRIWRFKDLNKFELKCHSSCYYGYEMKLDSICINPYHYERIICSSDLPSLNMSPLMDVADKEILSDTETTDEIKSHADSIESNKNSTMYENQSIDLDHHSLNSVRLNQSTSHLTSEPDNDEMSKRSYISNNSWDSKSANKSMHDSMNDNSQEMSSNAMISSNSTNSINMMANSSRLMNKTSQNNSNSNVSTNPIPNCLTSLPKSAQNLAQSGVGITSLKPPEYWCSIAYFELDQHVGELFKVRSQHSRVTVDGYTDPSSPNRFCLGQLSNVHRSDQSEKSRLYIGKGVELDNVGEGDVWIRCLSELSVFVQSYYLDREAGRNPGDAVHKIYPGAYIKIFDIRQCHQQMHQLAQTAQAAAIRQAAAVVGTMSLPQQQQPTANATTSTSSSAVPSQASLLPTSIGTTAAGVGVDDLRRLCMLRLSFVKGWGPDYPRATIKETPCWIEIQLHRPLLLLDEVLQAMPLNDLKPSRQFFPNYYNNNNNNLSQSTRTKYNMNQQQQYSSQQQQSYTSQKSHHSQSSSLYGSQFQQQHPHQVHPVGQRQQQQQATTTVTTTPSYSMSNDLHMSNYLGPPTLTQQPTQEQQQTSQQLHHQTIQHL